MSCLIAGVTLISGCATVLDGTTQNVRFQAVNSRTNQVIPGAMCMISDGSGQQHRIANPGSVVLTKGAGALNVSCKKNGFYGKEQGVGQNFSKLSLINILFWPGFIVDAATGAIQHYPENVTIYMDQANSGRRG